MRPLQALLCEQCVAQGYDREPLVVALLAKLACRCHNQVYTSATGTELMSAVRRVRAAVVDRAACTWAWLLPLDTAQL